ncbi:hypothetical protein WJX74_006786 [Apatococcus lobatus]|uniref:Uncharacterized protein n=1 Tax=Apatococcus lobatus TaxID=904363 RepID=A0AAW1RDS1_9CHLO
MELLRGEKPSKVLPVGAWKTRGAGPLDPVLDDLLGGLRAAVPEPEALLDDFRGAEPNSGALLGGLRVAEPSPLTRLAFA